MKETRPAAWIALALLSGFIGFMAGEVRQAERLRQEQLADIDHAARLQVCETHLSQAQTYLAQIRQQLMEHKAHTTTNPSEGLLWNAIGAILGVPPGVTHLAQAIVNNLPASSPPAAVPVGIEQRIHAVTQKRVIETLMQSCGTSVNGICIVDRMCPARPEGDLMQQAYSCRDSPECWRAVLHDCGSDAFNDVSAPLPDVLP